MQLIIMKIDYMKDLGKTHPSSLGEFIIECLKIRVNINTMNSICKDITLGKTLETPIQIYMGNLFRKF